MKGDRLFNKRCEFLKSKKVKLIVMFVILAIIGSGIIYSISIYNQHKSDIKVQTVISKQKINNK